MLAAASPLLATAITVHGYVTVVNSPQSFQIDDYRIIPATPLQTLRIGTELEITGELDPTTRELRATHINVADDTTTFRRTAVVEQSATLQRDGNGWTGVLRLDGETVRIDTDTRVLLSDRESNRISPGFVITYEGERQRDGSIAASRFQVVSSGAGNHNGREASPHITAAGEIVIRGVHYKLAPDAEAQSYVQRIGSKLVPRVYAQDLSEGAARRLSFQFFLVQNPEFNAQAFPGGTVLVNSGVLRVLSSEAQLAAVLGHEIAHATQDRGSDAGTSWTKAFLHLGKTEAAASGYPRELENQADRIGLEYMIAAGYDPREAAEVWKELPRATSAKSSPAWNTGDDPTLRRSFLLAEINSKHATTDFRAFVRNTAEFDTLAERFGNTSIRNRAPAVDPEVHPGIIGPISVTPAPAAPAQQNVLATNFVTIVSQPEGAEVWMGGRVIGKTPMNLLTGHVGMPFTLVVRKPGYRDWTGYLVSVPGKTNLRVDMYRQ